MPISSNTLFHFTNTIDNLINILKIEFHPRYSAEDFKKILGVTYEEGTAGIPMISFCDIPLSNISRHLKLYGSYGIGMAKEWGIKNGVNPIIYVCPESFLAYKLKSLLASIVRVRKTLKTMDMYFELVMGFVKPYKGVMYRRGRRYNNIKFYDEREWRYVPHLSKENKGKYENIGWYLSGRYCFDKRIVLEANKKLEQKYTLHFSPKDIRYIIVKNDKDRLQIIKNIREIKSRRYDEDTVSILSSKIITKQQILEDF